MRPLTLRSTLVGILVVMALGLVAAVAAAAIPSISPKPAAATQSGEGNAGNNAAKYCDTFVGHVAGNLNKSPEELKAALAKAIDQTLADAVKNGDISQAGADKFKAQFDKSGGGCPALTDLKSRVGLGNAAGGAALLKTGLEAAAAALKTTPSDLKSGIAAGKTLHAIADANGVSKDQFTAGTKANLKKQLDTAVASGKMTQAAEDRLLATVDQTIDALWDKDLSAGFAGSVPGGPTKKTP
ncbi:MAG: hypothetical protein M3O87_03480 [Candidatus Dormibacteraeota bacterium]|nr:hypothetical protein [Candidatus Dormibacteraeota bacterium]